MSDDTDPERRTALNQTQLGASADPCCDLHKATDCCDPDDCGPCCEGCPTCPALARHRAVNPAKEHAEMTDPAPPWGRAQDGRPLLPMGARWTDIPELLDARIAEIRARVDQAQPGAWYAQSTEGSDTLVHTQYDGYTRLVGRITNTLPADLDMILHAHEDLHWCLGVIDKLRTQQADEARCAAAHHNDPTAWGGPDAMAAPGDTQEPTP